MVAHGIGGAGAIVGDERLEDHDMLGIGMLEAAAAEQDAARRALERMSSGTAVELNKDGTGGVSEEEDSL